MGFAEMPPGFGRAANAAIGVLLGLQVVGCALEARNEQGSFGSAGGPGSAGSAGVGDPAARGGAGSAGANSGGACDAETRCSAEGVLQACRSGVWSTLEVCKGADHCSAARRSCLSCVPGTFACMASGTLEQCALDGSTWETVRDCGAPSACNAEGDVGYCSLCVTGESLCEAQDLRRCNEDGSGTEAVAHCTFDAPVCSAEAARCQVCVPNRSVCNGRVLAQCDATGSALLPLAECASSAQCDATGGACLPAGCARTGGKQSAVGEVICEKTTLSVCRSSGAWEVLDICGSEAACNASLSARECLDASETHCTPGSSSCAGNTLRRCAGASAQGVSSLQGGSWYGYAECAAGCKETSTDQAECVAAPSGGPYVETTLCEPGAASYSTCTSSGCTITTCPVGKVCGGSSLGCTNCVPGGVRCDGERLLRCDARGERETLEKDCAGNYCDQARARCLPAPVGERYCDRDGRLLSVSADGNSRLVSDCGGAALCEPFGCLTGVCRAGALACGGSQGNRVFSCADGAAWIDTGESCSNAQRCVDGLGCARAVKLAAGDAHSCALLAPASDVAAVSGALVCWGANESGQLGNGSSFLSDEAEARPVSVALYADDQKSSAIFRTSGLCAGKNFTCADVDLSGGEVGVACFGANDRGQLGQALAKNGSTQNSIAFAVTRRGDDGQRSRFTGLHAVTCGADFACALDEDSRAYCWGGNDYGQLGSGDDSASNGAIAVSGLGKLLTIVAGARHVCAIDTHSQVYCWGDNGRGALGQGSAPAELAKSNLPLRLTGVTAEMLAAGQGFAFALDVANGVPEATSWGQNQFGQLATGNALSTPLPLAARLDGAVERIISGPSAFHACALGGGSLSCWGANVLAELGDGTRDDRTLPTLALDGAITPLLGGAGSVALGKAHSCAIAQDGSVYCWGANQRRQLGLHTKAATVAAPFVAYP